MSWACTWYEEVGDGLPGLGPPETMVASVSDDRTESETAARELTTRYTVLAGSTGFLCGLPGYLVMPVTLPANVAGVLLLQLHMARSLALVTGHEPAEPEVRDLCLREVLGSATPGEVESPEVEDALGRALSKLGERGVRFAGEQAPRLVGRGGRSLPLLGGLVGAYCDARSTSTLGRRLRRRLRAAAGEGTGPDSPSA